MLEGEVTVTATPEGEDPVKLGAGELVLNAASGYSVAIATNTAYNAEGEFRDKVTFQGFTTFSGDFYHSGAGVTFK